MIHLEKIINRTSLECGNVPFAGEVRRFNCLRLEAHRPEASTCPDVGSGLDDET